MEKIECVSHTPRKSPPKTPKPAPANGPNKPPANVHGVAEKIITVEPGACAGMPGMGNVPLDENSNPRNNVAMGAKIASAIKIHIARCEISE